MKHLLVTLTLTLTSILHTGTPVQAHTKTQGTCSNPYFDAAAAYAGWPVEEIPKVGRIAYRESRCNESARNRCCSGLMQIHRSWLKQLGLERNDLYYGFTNLAAAYYVWTMSGWRAWSL